MSKTERRRTRVNSTIDRLPDDIKGRLDLKLTDTANTYEELSAWLKEEGYEISKSAIGATRSAAPRRRSGWRRPCSGPRSSPRAVATRPDLDYTKAASMVLMDGLMQRVSTAEDDFQEMPLDKAGGSSPPWPRNATYEQRVRQEMKRKAELAFDQMETELLEKVKQYPDLAAQLRDVLAKARERVVADGGD